MDRRGVLGLETVKVVMITFLVLAVLGVAIVLTLTNISDVAEKIDLVTGNVYNETLTTVAEIGELFAYGTEVGCTAVLGDVTNATDGVVIEAANYTHTRCSINFSGESSSYMNNTDWNVTYSYSYSHSRVRALQENVTTGTTGFFENTDTIFAILVVVVIILAIAIIIAVVSGFGGSALGGGRRRSSGTITGM